MTDTDELPWRLSFRVRHPSADLSGLAERIGDAFGMDARWLWRAGELNLEAKPPRVRSESYCCVEWLDTDGPIEIALGEALDALAPLRAELADIVTSGGTLDFFTGLFVERSLGVVLSPPLLGRMAEAAIALQLDIYGGPRHAPLAPPRGGGSRTPP